MIPVRLLLTMGTIMERDPIPIPVIKRPARIEEGPAGETPVVWIMTPRTKMPVSRIMAYFRERISATNPAQSVPNHAPSSRIDVSHPLRVGSSFESDTMKSKKKKLTFYVACHMASKVWHGKYTTENALVIAIEQAACPILSVGTALYNFIPHQCRQRPRCQRHECS